MRRLGDLLPEVASSLGMAEELRRSRQMAAWNRLVAELVPAAAGESNLLALQPPALVVSATRPIVAQELSLRAAELLDAFASSPEGQRLLELRVVTRPLGTAGGPSRPHRGSRVD